MTKSARTTIGPPEISADYDVDFYAWTQEQAAALRHAAASGSKVAARLDWEHLAEEIEDMGKSTRRALESDLARIVEYLVKLQYSPATHPVPGWRDTVREHRYRAERILDDSPSLIGQMGKLLERAYKRGAEKARASMKDRGEIDSGFRMPSECPYGISAILGHEEWPERPEGKRNPGSSETA